MTTMTQQQLIAALAGLYAYDTGCDSGIHDELLRARAREELTRIAEDGRTDSQLVGQRFSAFFSALLDDLCLGQAARRQGYGYEDACCIIRWLQDKMGVPEV